MVVPCFTQSADACDRRCKDRTVCHRAYYRDRDCDRPRRAVCQTTGYYRTGYYRPAYYGGYYNYGYPRYGYGYGYGYGRPFLGGAIVGGAVTAAALSHRHHDYYHRGYGYGYGRHVGHYGRGWGADRVGHHGVARAGIRAGAVHRGMHRR